MAPTRPLFGLRGRFSVMVGSICARAGRSWRMPAFLRTYLYVYVYVLSHGGINCHVQASQSINYCSSFALPVCLSACLPYLSACVRVRVLLAELLSTDFDC